MGEDEVAVTQGSADGVHGAGTLVEDVHTANGPYTEVCETMCETVVKFSVPVVQEGPVESQVALRGQPRQSSRVRRRHVSPERRHAHPLGLEGTP